MRHPAPREFSHPQLSLEDFFDRRNGYQEMLRDSSGTRKWILLEKCPKLWTQSQELSTGKWKVLAWEIAAFEPMEPDFDLGLPISIVAKCAEEFVADSFCAPSFDPKIFDHKSLVFFVHLSSLTDFVTFSN
jgi:hypothetical protein